MIFGIGHDIVENNRIAELLHKYQQKFITKILTTSEIEFFNLHKNKVNYIAKRFAAKEALAKACGTGLRCPILLQNMSVLNDNLGKPYFKFSTELQQWLNEQKIQKCHLSLTDEINTSSAFVILEKLT